MMKEEHRDVSLFIGLHKLAEQNGDGLVPELYALWSARAEAAPDMTNVVALPVAARSVKYAAPANDKEGVVLAFNRRQ